MFLGSRDRGRGDAAFERLLQAKAGRTDRVQAVEIDVASDESVARGARTVRDACGSEKLYRIVNNAGIGIGSSCSGGRSCHHALRDEGAPLISLLAFASICTQNTLV